jgi:hypothetical protein
VSSGDWPSPGPAPRRRSRSALQRWGMVAPVGGRRRAADADCLSCGRTQRARVRRWARACADDLLLRVRRDDRGDQPVCQWRGAGAAPRAELVFTECEAGWLAWAMQHWDYVHQAAYSSTAGVGMLLDYRLPKRPSEYVRTQVKTTFMFDPVAIANRRLTGNECLLWGSDYPHQEGVFPHSQASCSRAVCRGGRRRDRPDRPDQHGGDYGLTATPVG